MKDKIIEVLKQIELDKNIKILFAVECGSRAWRLNSADSDYDIRFVFVRDIDEYIRVNPSDDVIMSFYDKDGNKSPQEGCFIDIEGFDIFKFTKMLSSSNPTVIEWLLSDIVYLGEKSKVFLDFATNQFNFKSLYYHYKSMCRSNYIKYLKSDDDCPEERRLATLNDLNRELRQIVYDFSVVKYR